MLKPIKMDDPRTYAMIGAAMEVDRELGPGFLEGVYQDALEIEFQLRGIPYVREKGISISYKGQPLQHLYRADFICYDAVLVETKALKQLNSADVSQILNYLRTYALWPVSPPSHTEHGQETGSSNPVSPNLKATGLKVSLLINFGKPSLEYRRFANDKNSIKEIYP